MIDERISAFQDQLMEAIKKELPMCTRETLFVPTKAQATKKKEYGGYYWLDDFGRDVREWRNFTAT